MNPKPILVAEDHENDILLLRLALQKAGIINPLQLVRDGLQALAYLKGEGQFANRVEYPLPCVLFLDLKLPEMDGFEVLRWVRQRPNLSALRTVVLTSSQDLNHVNKAYALGASSFLVKPVDFSQFPQLKTLLNGCCF